MPDTTEVPEMERESMLKDLDIPSVRERDPDPMAGPRLNVTEFRVQGIVEFPELGITRETLNELVENIRFDLMSEGEMLESGYTLDEVGEISDLIAEIEESSDEAYVGPSDVQRLVFLIREQRRRRGVTLGMIETVADTITRYYRERGFFLAKAYIPEQRVRDGIVTLTLLLGELGSVQVHNNELYDNETVEGIFGPNIGEPVTADGIEERLLFVNDMPGLSAQAFFEPGKQVGDTLLNVNVVEEKEFAGNVRIDNHGSENTGEYRLYTDGYWHNPLGYGDQFHIGLLGTFEPSNSLYGSIHYGIPLFSPRAKFTFGGSTNDFVTQNISGNTRLTGQSLVIDATLNYILERSRVKNYSTEIRFSEIDTDIEGEGNDGGNSGAFDRDQDEIVRSADLVFNFDILHERWRALHQGGIRITWSDYVKGRNTNQEDHPIVFAVNYSFLKFIKIPFFDAQTRVLLKTAGQYSESSLPATSQFSLAGPNRMRGFKVNEFNADNGIYIAADWLFQAPSFLDFDLFGENFKDSLQPYLFAEYGYGVSYFAGLPTTDNSNYDSSYNPTSWARLIDLGMGIKYTYSDNLRLNINYAHTVDFILDTEDQPRYGLDSLEDRAKLYFDMQYSF